MALPNSFRPLGRNANRLVAAGMLIFFFFLSSAFGGEAVPRRLVVAGGSDYAPFGYEDTEGNPRGILVDIWQLWSRKTGTTVEYRILPWAEALAAVDRGDADVVAGFFYSDSRAKKYDFSPPFLSISSHIFFHHSIYGIKGPEDLHGFRVGVVHGDYAEAYLQTHAPGTEVVAFSSYLDMIRAAVDGEIRIFLCDTPIALYYLNKMNKAQDYQRSFKPLYANKVYAGIPKGHETTHRLVVQGFDDISEKEIDAIQKQWTGVSWVRQIPWRWLVASLGSILLVAVLVTLVNRGLRRRIAMATADLEEKRRLLEASEKKSRENEQRFRTLAENTDDSIVRFDRALRPLYANPVVESLTGISREAFASTPAADLGFSRELIARAEKAIARVFETGKKYRLETELPNGIWIDWLLIPEKDTDGNVKTILTSAREITDRKRFEQSLLESEEKYRRLFEMESDAIFLVEEESGRILEANTAAEALYGYPRESLLQMSDSDLSADPQPARPATSALPDKEPAPYHRKMDGTVFPVEITISHFTWQGEAVHVAAIRDVSFRVKAEAEKKGLEAQFHQAQRLESMGTLAGGIAHDFNNLLMGIQGHASLVLAKLARGDKSIEHLRGIEGLVKSASDLTRQLLGFARSGKYEVRPTDMNTLVRETATMFGRTRKEIQIQTKLDETLWSAEVDRGQLEQVLLNLYINAWHAMPCGGALVIETANARLDEVDVRPFSVPSGNYVRISVTDSGIGMSEETQQRIFDPFFTTKEMGRGTGLGLASAYGIIQNHEGIIQVNSQKGQGSTFFIYLPASTQGVAEDVESRDVQKQGTETVLLVDDETIVIDVAEGMLKALGYSVLTAKNGREAIDRFSRDPSTIDLVILDMIMPDMSGAETFDALRAIHPEIRVLLSSGYSINGKATEIIDKGCNGFIQKPFTLTELSKKIRAILDPP